MILVTGGTGFVGREIVRQLISNGHKVRVLVRDAKQAEPFRRKYGCELTEGNVLEPASLPEAMRGVKAVIHLVGVITETSKATFEDVHMQGTANVVKAANHAGVRRFVHMSALGTRADACSRYHRSKWEGEELVRRSGMDWTILRPSLIYGPEDKSLNVMVKWMRWPRDFSNFYGFPNPGGGLSRVQPVAVEDVAEAFVRALGNTAAVGKTYDVCGPHALVWRDLLLFMAEKQDIQAVFDKHALLYAMRVVAWILLLGLPMTLGLCLAFHLLSVKGLILLATLWVGILFILSQWKEFLFFTVPWSVLHVLAWIADKILPRRFHFGEQLKMLKEDNIGDSEPVKRDLHLSFKAFAETWEPS